MREFLLELYLKHGERHWVVTERDMLNGSHEVYWGYKHVTNRNYVYALKDIEHNVFRCHITSNGVEYLKNA